MAQASALSRVMILNFFAFNSVSTDKSLIVKKESILAVFDMARNSLSRDRPFQISVPRLVCRSLKNHASIIFFYQKKISLTMTGTMILGEQWIDQRSRIDSVGFGKMGSQAGQASPEY